MEATPSRAHVAVKPFVRDLMPPSAQMCLTVLTKEPENLPVLSVCCRHLMRSPGARMGVVNTAENAPAQAIWKSFCWSAVYASASQKISLPYP